MPKIRDLGINFIPATMRPPEIGGGGGYYMGDDCQNSLTDRPCNVGCTTTDEWEEDDDEVCKGCTSTDKDKDKDKEKDKGLKLTGFGPQVVAQLKQQLRNEISKGLEY